MDVKRTSNLKVLSQTSDHAFDDLLESVRSDIEYEKHCALGLGKRMPLPRDITFT